MEPSIRKRKMMRDSGYDADDESRGMSFPSAKSQKISEDDNASADDESPILPNHEPSGGGESQKENMLLEKGIHH